MPYRNLVFALAGLGILLTLIHRVRLGYFLALTVMAFAWIFRFFPQYRLWNARLLPFYYLALYLLAGLALALVIRSVAIAVQEWWQQREEPAWVGAFGAGLVALVAAVTLMGAFSWLPGGTPGTDPNNPNRAVYSWGGIDFETTIVHNWASWNYAGLEGKDAYPEFAGIMDMMTAVGEEHGCGRAMWEYEGDLQRFGTPMALMLLPYFTDGCIGSMEGLYFESSTTTPFHFLNQSELSTGPSRAQRDLPYSEFDIQQGISHLQMMGVKYYMATTDAAIEAALTDDRLTQVADESFAYIDSNTGAPTEQRWVVFEVAETDLVVPMENEPVVLSDADDHIDGWVYEVDPPEGVEGQPKPPKGPGPAVLWYNDPNRWAFRWRRRAPTAGSGRRRPRPRSRSRPTPTVEVSERRGGHRLGLVRGRPDRRAGHGAHLVLPQLDRERCRRPLPGHPQLHGRGAHGEPGDAQLRSFPGRVAGHPGDPVGLSMVGCLMVLDHRRRLVGVPGRRHPISHRRSWTEPEQRRPTPRATPRSAVNLLRRITLVGTTATVIDVVLFVVLVEWAGWQVWWADAAAVAGRDGGVVGAACPRHLPRRPDPALVRAVGPVPLHCGAGAGGRRGRGVVHGLAVASGLVVAGAVDQVAGAGGCVRSPDDHLSRHDVRLCPRRPG